MKTSCVVLFRCLLLFVHVRVYMCMYAIVYECTWHIVVYMYMYIVHIHVQWNLPIVVAYGP